MRLSVTSFVSLDGFVQGPTEPGDDPDGWFVAASAEGRLWPVNEWLAHADALLLNGRTFKSMRASWSHSQDKVGPALNRLHKYVVSEVPSNTDAAWGSITMLDGDVVEKVRRLKECPGRELQVHGSWELVRTVHDAGLVDLYRLVLLPLVLGEGERLFAAGAAPAIYRVAESALLTIGSGAVSMVLSRSMVDRAEPKGLFVVPN